MKSQLFSKILSSILIVMLALVTLPVTPARAADTGLNSPTGCVSGGGEWTNPGNATASDNTRTDSNANNEDIICTFNLPAIPVGNTIAGIEVTIEGLSSGTREAAVDLSWNGGGGYTGSDPLTIFGATETTFTLGGVANTWGRTWSNTEFTSANFRVRLTANNGSGTISLDHIQVRVTYFPQSTITATAGAGGTITPSGAVIVDYGEDQDFDIEPNAGFIVSDVIVDAVSQGRINYYDFNNVTANHDISATFDGGWYEPNNDTETGWNNTGDVDDSDNQYADANGAGDIAIFEDFDFVIPASATINGIEVAIEGNADTTAEVSVDLSWNNGGGYTGIDPSTNFVNGGNDATIVLGGAANLWGRTWTVAEFSNANFQVRLTTTGAGDIEIDQVQVKVHFTAPSHTITASDDGNGTITPSGALIIYEGFDQDFDITPDTGFIVSNVLVDAVSQGRINYHEFTNVTASHTIHAPFEGGWSQPSADTDTGWGNEDEAYVSDNDYAVANDTADVAQFFNFGLSIPGAATITGIEVAIEGNAETTRELVVDLSWNSGTNFTPTTATTTFTNGGTDVTLILGNSTDTWGRTWTPAEFTNFRVRLDATGGGGDVNVDQVQVKVHYIVNTAPTGTDNTLTINEDTNQTFATTDFGFNDVDAGDVMSAVRIDALSLPVGATLQLSSVNVTAGQVITTANIPNLVFTPATNANGASYASFTFSVRDTNGSAFDITPNTMTFNITAVNDAPSFTASNPTAVNEDAGTQTNIPFVTAVDFGPTDEDSSQAVSQYIISNSTCGTLLSAGPTVNTSGQISYTPAADQNGTCTFDVQVQDNGGNVNGGVDTSPAQTFTITVNSVNDEPSFTASNPLAVNEDAGAQTVAGWITSFDLGPTDEDSSQSVLAYNISGSTCGTLLSAGPAVDNSGTLTYTPAANQNGTCNFNVAIQDNGGTANSGDDTSPNQNFTITVNAVDDASTANDDSATVAEDASATTINVRGNDSDIDSTVENITTVTQPTNGTVVITNGGADLTYQPDANYCNNGTPTDDFTYTLTNGSTADVLVTVTCVDDTSIANDDSATVAEDASATTINVRGNDTDIDSAVENITSVTQPTNGTVVITNGGLDLTYQPDANYCNNGTPTDDFTYTLTNGSTADVSVTVTCVDDASTANDDSATVWEDSSATTINVRSNDTDIDSTVENIASVTQPTNGTVVITNAGADLTYQPDAEYCNGGSPTDDFTYTLTGGDTATVQVTVDCQTVVTASITANNKVYDGDNTATFTCSLTGVTPPDVVTCTGGTATFADKNVGNGKLVTATGLGLTGADAFKYELASTSATDNANITERTLNVTATGIDKVYDGNTTATVTLSDDRFLGDLLTVSYTSADFVDPNVGVNITINVSGISITGGVDASNYVLGNTTTVTDADITIVGQTINVTTSAPASATNGSSFNVAATATSGLPVTITVSGVCSIGDVDGSTIDGDATITMTSGTGTCSVFYDQAGNSNYTAAPQVQEDVNATDSPVFTSANTTTFDFGFSGTFNITATGNPSTMTISITGEPAGITITDNGDGTATLNGDGSTPVGTYTITFTANNGVAPNGTQSFTLIIRNGPVVSTVNSLPDTGNGSVSENESISNTLGITQITIQFNRDVYDAGISDPDSVTNPANYLLVRSATGTFSTTSCIGGLLSPDIQISVDSVTYDNGGGSGPFVATLNVNSGLPLNVAGFYRLFVCGTTSIVDATNPLLSLAGNGVTPGTDFTRNFRITAPTSGGGGGNNSGSGTTTNLSGVLIPVTGFTPNQVTKLPAQSVGNAYTASKLRIEIPSLSMDLPIVGIALKDKQFDVTWLGNNAGYLEGSAYPTWQGNSILTSHVTDANGKPGPFAYVNELSAGDQIYIHNNGFIYVYEVRESKLVLPNKITELFKHEEDYWLTLVTCENFDTKSETFTHRRIVRAVLISIIPEK